MITTLNHYKSASSETDFSDLLLNMHDIVKNRVAGGVMESLEWIILYLMAVFVRRLMSKDIQKPIVIDAINCEKYKKIQEKLHQILAQNTIQDTQKLNWFWFHLYKNYEQIYELAKKYSQKIEEALLLNERKISQNITEMSISTEWDLTNIEKNYQFNLNSVFGKLECKESAEEICNYLRQNK